MTSSSLTKKKSLRLDDLDEILERLFRREHLSESTVKMVCEKAKEILSNEPNVKPVRAPVTVVGDVRPLSHSLTLTHSHTHTHTTGTRTILRRDRTLQHRR